MTWVIAILKPLQLYLEILVLSFYRKETKSNLCSGLVCKNMVSAHVIPERLVHLIEECSGFDCSSDFFFFFLSQYKTTCSSCC